MQAVVYMLNSRAPKPNVTLQCLVYMFTEVTLMPIATLQAVVYMFTDIQIADRYNHAGQCYRYFYDRARLLSKWMQEVSNQRCLVSLAKYNYVT